MSARQLVFDPAAHRYSVAGSVLPSVTAVLKPLSSYESVPPAVLANKAAIGQAAHRAVELLNEGRLDTSSLHPAISPYLAAYESFARERSFTPGLGEARVWHPALGYAGTLDLLGSLGGAPAMVDLKCTVALMPMVGPQTAAYREAAINTPELAEEQRELARASRRFCLQLHADGKYTLTPCDDPNDWRVFVALLTIHNFRMKHAHHYAK